MKTYIKPEFQIKDLVSNKAIAAGEEMRFSVPQIWGTDNENA